MNLARLTIAEIFSARPRLPGTHSAGVGARVLLQFLSFYQQCVAWFWLGNRLSAGEVLIMLTSDDMVAI